MENLERNPQIHRKNLSLNDSRWFNRVNGLER
jgi:hypothetical protein